MITEIQNLLDDCEYGVIGPAECLCKIKDVVFAARKEAATATQELRDEVGRLREALEFYAADHSYNVSGFCSDFVEAPINTDKGQRAREALKEQSK